MVHQLFGFIDFKMTYKRIIIVSTDQLKTNQFWYIRESFMVEYYVDFLLVFLQLYGPNFLNSQVYFL